MAFFLKFDWFFLILISLFTRLLPFLIYGQNPLGYDTGFYRHYLIQPNLSFPNHATAGLSTSALIPRIILDTAKLSGLTTDILLYGMLIIATTATALSLYFILKKSYNQETGFITTLLFIFSSVQYTGYWFFLFKNYIALPLLFLFLYQLKKFLDQPALLQKIKSFSFSIKELIFLCLPAILVFFSHKTTSIILIISFFFSLILFLIKKVRHKINLLSLLISSLLIILALIKLSLWQKIHPYPPAIFLEWSSFFWLITPLLFIILLNLKNLLPKIISHPFFPLFLTSFLFTLLQWTFYQRIFLFLDIVLLSFATLSFNLFRDFYLLGNQKQKLEVAIILAIFSGWYLANFYLTVQKYPPIISKEEITEIKKIDNLTEKNATILTVSDYMPWVYGWNNKKVISPGLLEYNYNLEDWQKFWFQMNTKEKINFLKIFPKPLYFFTEPNSDDNFLEAPCVKEKTKYLRSFECSN